jgi:hypothetical protein
MNRVSAGQPPFNSTRPNPNAALDRSRATTAEMVGWCEKHVPDLPLPFACGALSTLVGVHGRGKVTARMVRERVHAFYPHLKEAA